MSNPDSAQCIATTKIGNRCKNRTVITHPKCWVHTMKQDHLRVKRSHIPGAGYGLYAEDKNRPKDTVLFKKNENVVPYEGSHIMSKADLNKIPPSKRDYIMELNQFHYVDGYKRSSGLGRYANDCRTSNKKGGDCPGNNARISKYTKGVIEKLNLKANTNIKNGQEVYISYGKGYWDRVKRLKKNHH